MRDRPKYRRRHPGTENQRPQPETLDTLSDEALLERLGSALQKLVGDDEAVTAGEVAASLLAHRDVASTIDVPGLRSLLYQLTRNRDPEMQSNHLTELRVASALARVPGRSIEVERAASGRNERRVDFALDEAAGTTLVEVKNLNAPLIKKSLDPLSERFRLALKGSVQKSDLHLVYLFFRRPRPDEVAAIEAEARARWAEMASASSRWPRVFFVPAHRPRLAGLVVPARPDTGGRVIVYDHGQHLTAEPGTRIRIVHHDIRHRRTPRERLEEMFVKDNVLRRLQDAEQKFPVDGECLRVVLFCQGSWAPVSHVDRCLDEAVHWYLHGQPAAGDVWGDYYPHWARRWLFSPLHNLDAVLAMRPTAFGGDVAGDERVVRGGDLDYAVREVYVRRPGLVARIFDGA